MVNMHIVYHKQYLGGEKRRDRRKVLYLDHMGLYLKQDENRSGLRLKIEQELQDKARKRAEGADELPDGVDDSAYIEQTKTTTSLAWVWIVIFLAIVGLLVWLLANAF